MTQLNKNEFNNIKMYPMNNLFINAISGFESNTLNPIDPDEFEDDDSNIEDGELDLLDESNDGEGDDKLLKDAELDNTDDDGDFLNESGDLSGEDLDVPGSDLDDDDELLGEEDEENNAYSKDHQENKL